MNAEQNTNNTASTEQNDGEQKKNKERKKKKKKIVRWVVGILTPFILAITIFLLLFGGPLNLFFQIKKGFEKICDFFAGEEQTEVLDFDVWVNEPENIIEAIAEGYLTYDGSGLHLADDDIVRVLERIVDYENGRKQEKEIAYEKGIFVENGTMIRSDASVTLRRSDTESEILDNGTDLFQLRWQLIIALCSMASVNHNDEWGETVQLDPTIPLEENETNDYFISDETIDAIINIVDFEFEYYYNYFDYSNVDYTWEDLDKGAYVVSSEEIVYEDPNLEEAFWQEALIINRCPANAPRLVSNSFITYVYNYEAYENEYADYFTSSGLRLVNRTISINPTTFVNRCKEYIPSFDFAWFLTNLKVLPGASDLYEQYYDYYKLYQKRKSLTETQECAIGMVVLGVNMPGVGQEDPENPDPGKPVKPPEGPGIIVEDGGFKIWVPSYNENLKYDGWYFLSNDTLLPLNTSDNLSLYQIQTLLDYIATHYKYNEECGLTSCAQALYDAQYTYGTSVCGVLAIVIQEGAIGTDKGTHWNYMNWAAASGQPTVDGRFRDFTIFGSPNAAMAAQLELMYRNWFDKEQTNYYEFIWNNYDYQNLSSITHSFCPCWDDSSFPWNRVDNPGIYVGWPNKCADYRNMLKNLL